jgi:hypothetical protein
MLPQIEQNIIKNLLKITKFSIFDMKTMEKWFQKIWEDLIYLFGSKEKRFYIRVKRNQVRIIDLMSIKLEKQIATSKEQVGLKPETVRKLNDLKVLKELHKSCIVIKIIK